MNGMVDPIGMRSDFEAAVSDCGIGFTYRYWASGMAVYSGSDYDEEYLDVGSATTGSGVCYFEPVGTDAAKYLPEGLLEQADRVLFIHGSLATTSNMNFTVLGSVYDVLDKGVFPWSVSGTVIYKEVYVRLSAGSYGVFDDEE